MLWQHLPCKLTGKLKDNWTNILNGTDVTFYSNEEKGELCYYIIVWNNSPNSLE